MGGMGPAGPGNLPGWIRHRRLERGLSIRTAARDARVRRATWGAWERRTGWAVPSDLMRPRIERVLRWRPGSVAVILAGGAPAPLPDPDPSEWTDPDTGEDYSADRVARELWALRHAFGEAERGRLGPAEADRMGRELARRHIALHRADRAMRPARARVAHTRQVT